MNPERIRESLPTIICTTLGLLFAVYCGSVIGSGQTTTLSIIAGGIFFLSLGITFRDKIWLMIPFTGLATGKLMFLPLPFTVADLGIITAFCWFLILRAVRIVHHKPRFNRLDLILGINLAYVAITFLRNPVGTFAGGSELIGGRPYFDIALATCGYWVLQRADLTEKIAYRFPIISIVSGSLNFIASTVSYFIPATVPYLSRIYSGIDASQYLSEENTGTIVDANPDEINRIGYLAGFGAALSLALYSYYRSITLILPTYFWRPRWTYFWRFKLMSLAIFSILLSGFRNTIVAMGIYFLLSIFYQRRTGDLWRLLFYAVPSFVLIISLQGVLFELPLTAQRTLSFLPGRWSPAAKADAEGSVEWRVYMWKALFEENKYIKNRILGDGFGYSLADSRAMEAATDLKAAHSTQENFLVTGDLHSGPLSTIRFVGYVGLGLYLLLAFSTLAAAHRLIRRAYGTRYFPMAMFVGLPAIYGPFHFIFVYGGYKQDLASLIISIGYLKLLERGLLAYEEKKRREATAAAAATAAAPAIPGILLDHRPALPGLLPQR